MAGSYTNTTERPGVDPDNIPAVLTCKDQWVCWDYEMRGGSKPTKVPKQPNGRPASSTDPKTWSPFDECLEAYRRGDCDGIGFAGLEETGYSGIDIDHCVNLETEEISPEALNISQSLDSYAEFTPSDGIRIWIVGEKPDHSWVSNKSDPERAVDIEVYSAGRFFTITGQRLPGVPDIIMRRQAEFDAFMDHYAPVRPRKRERKPYDGPEAYQLDLDGFMEEHGIEILRELYDHTSDTAYAIVCPWAEEHTGGDTSGTRIGQYPDGALWFHCEHAHCAERGWEQIRERFEPGCYDGYDGYDRSDSYDSSFKDLGDLPDAADFPLEALPGSFRDFVREASASIGCPPDLVGIAAIAAASAAIGDTRRIVIKRDWSESATVYGMAISPPGGKKSPAISAALRPVRDRQMAHKLEYDRQMEEYKAVLAGLKKGDEKPPKPTLIRTYADDTTVERLADILNENKRGILITKDELAAWLGSMNQYKQGKGSDRQFWLSVHTNQPVAVDRKNLGEPVIIPRPFVSLIGGIQPQVLPDFGNDRGDGLIERFLCVYPNPRRSRWTDDEMREEVRDAYAKTIGRLYRLMHAQEDDPFPHRVEMNAEAKEMFIEEYDRMHDEMEEPGFPERLLPAWSKLEAYLARLALILAEIRIAEKDQTFPIEIITREDMLGAATLLAYFKNHTRRVYAGLYGESLTDRLAVDIRDFLVTLKNASWEGTAAELNEQLPSEHKPEKLEGLAKAVRRIAKTKSWLKFEELPRQSDRRPFRLTLRT